MRELMRESDPDPINDKTDIFYYILNGGPLWLRLW